MKNTILLAAAFAFALPGMAHAQMQAPTCAPLKILNTIAMQPAADGTMMVPVTINGAPKKLLLDTGAPVGQVSEAMVKQLQLPEFIKNDYNQMRAVDVRGAVKADAARRRVSVGSFGLGQVTGSGIQFQIAADPELGKAKPYDGYLGMDLFTFYDLDMDFGAHRLNYFDPYHCPSQVVYWPREGLAVIPIKVIESKIIVPVTVDGRSFDAVLDTGAARTTMRRGIAETRYRLKANTPEMMPVEGMADSKGQPIYAHTFNAVSLEGVAVKNLAVLLQTNRTISDPDEEQVTLGSRASSNFTLPELVIGMDVLSRLHVYAAFGENKLYVTPAATGESVLFNAANPPK